MRIILLLLMYMNLFSYELVSHGVLDVTNITYDATTTQPEEDHPNNSTRVELYLNNDIKTDDVFISTSLLYFYMYNDIYNNTFKERVGDINSLVISDLYIGLPLNNKVDLSAGVFNFRNGTFYEYGFNDI